MKRVIMPTISMLAIVLAACGDADAGADAAPQPAATPEAPAEDSPLGQWQWLSFQGMDDSMVEAPDPTAYTLEIRADGASVQADCNRGSGGVTVDGSSITFTDFATTQMACPPESLGDRYLRDLGDVRSWVIRDGDLYLALMMDAGIMRFRRAGS